MCSDASVAQDSATSPAARACCSRISCSSASASGSIHTSPSARNASSCGTQNGSARIAGNRACSPACLRPSGCPPRRGVPLGLRPPPRPASGCSTPGSAANSRTGAGSCPSASTNVGSSCASESSSTAAGAGRPSSSAAMQRLAAGLTQRVERAHQPPRLERQRNRRAAQGGARVLAQRARQPPLVAQQHEHRQLARGGRDSYLDVPAPGPRACQPGGDTRVHAHILDVLEQLRQGLGVLLDRRQPERAGRALERAQPGACGEHTGEVRALGRDQDPMLAAAVAAEFDVVSGGEPLGGCPRIRAPVPSPGARPAPRGRPRGARPVPGARRR